MCFKSKIGKKKIDQKTILSISLKRRWLRKRIAISLLLILFCLFCLDGEAYAHCKSIFPDEIMDLHGHFLSFLSESEKPIFYEGEKEVILSSFTDRYVSWISTICKEKSCFPINCCHLFDLKKRLFIFHHYNS